MKTRLAKVFIVSYFVVCLIIGLSTFPVWMLVYVLTGFNFFKYLDTLRNVID